MNKILLALAILGAGTAGALTGRHSTMRLQREASAARESFVVQTQVLTDAQTERARLSEGIRELKQNLRQAEAAGNQNGLWSVLETNRIGHLAPDLREHLLEELSFNWNSSEAFIVVSKETVREIRMKAITGLWPEGDDWHGSLSDSAAAILALTPQERSRVEAAMERIKEELTDWAISHTERSEPHDDVLAQYTLQTAPPTSISNNIMSEISSAIGKERTELMQMGSSNAPIGSIQHWMSRLANWGGDKPVTMILRRFSESNNEVLKFQQSEYNRERWNPIWTRFPTILRPLFPNGWADVAEREGFELPKRTEPK